MRTKTTLRNLFVLGFVSAIIYAVIDGIREGSPWGLSMALCSMVAFIYCVRLSRKLAKLREEEEQY
jgi:small basic protein